MEITKWRKSKTERHGGIFLHVTRAEALALIKSLAAQLLANSPDVERQEHFAKDGTYVSIVVEPECPAKDFMSADTEGISQGSVPCWRNIHGKAL